MDRTKQRTEGLLTRQSENWNQSQLHVWVSDRRHVDCRLGAAPLPHPQPTLGGKRCNLAMLKRAVRRVSAPVYVVGLEQLGETSFTYAQKVSLVGGHFCRHYTTGHASFRTRHAYSVTFHTVLKYFCIIFTDANISWGQPTSFAMWPQNT